MSGKITIGIFGAGRGESFAAMAKLTDAEVVAVCDKIKSKAENLISKHCPGAAYYKDFEEFITQDFDAVVLCNYFDEHAGYAIKAMEAGKHVMSECVCNITAAEGVKLCRAVEKSGKIYKLAENYPYFVSNMEIRRIYGGGTLGRVMYAEGEYVHPMSSREFNWHSPDEKHWRSWIPTTYYMTHALAPLMYMTDAMPVSVSAFAVSAPEIKKGTPALHSDGVGIAVCRMDNGAVFRVTGWAQLGGHGNWYRLSCTKGSVECVRGKESDIKLSYNHWDKPDNADAEQTYTAKWIHSAELADKAGHGGGDFWVMYNFIKAIKENKQPYFDVYRGVACSSAGIFAWKSVLNGSANTAMPDFRDETSRKAYENDHMNPNPFADTASEYKVPCGQDTHYKPTKEDLENAYKDWKEFGFM